MIPMDIPINAALNVGTPTQVPVQPAAAAAKPSAPRLPGRAGAGACKGPSFHDELRAVHDQMRAAHKEPRPVGPSDNPRSEDTGAPQQAAAKTTEAQTQPADDPQGCPETRQNLADLWSDLLQALQGISTALQPAESVSEPDADATGDELPADDTAQTLTQLIDILKLLQDAAQEVVLPSGDAERLSELCDQLKEATAAAPSEVLPTQVQQLLQDVREHLSGMAWGRMLKEIPADEPVALSVAEKEAPPADAVSQVRADAPDAVQNLPEASLQAIFRKLRAEAGPADRDPKLSETGSRTASTSGPVSGEAKPQDIEHEPLVRLPSTAAAPATHAGEGGRELGAARSAVTAAGPSGPLTGVREDQQAPTEGDRQPADDRQIAKAFAGADAAKPENTDPAEPFDMGTAGQRLLHLHPGGSEKAAEPVGGGKEKEAAGPGRAGVFDQIVQRAIVQVKTDQSEIKIDLKPDFLGNVRMQIVSENQQVSVRILTELPAVRDMIETGLQQLRSELQNQGLHVDRLEVVVSDDPRQSPRRQARPDELPKPGEVGAVSGTEGPVANGRTEPIYYQRRAGSSATIDMFV